MTPGTSSGHRQHHISLPCHHTAQHRTLDPTLCLVKAWAYTVHRLLRIPGSHSINDRQHFHRPFHWPPFMIHYSWSSSPMGKENLGFSTKLIGPHSNHSAAAMTMYLNGIPLYTIMILGRWSSDASDGYRTSAFSKIC